MSRRAQENLVAVALLAAFIGIIVMCRDFGPRAHMIPLPLAIAGAILTVVQLVWQNLRSIDELRLDMVAVPNPGIGHAPVRAAMAAGERSSWRSEVRAFCLVGVLLGFMLLVGPLPAVFLFTAGYFALTRHYSAGAALVYSALLTGAVYLLFFVALEIQPYHGLLESVIERV